MLDLKLVFYIGTLLILFDYSYLLLYTSEEATSLSIILDSFVIDLYDQLNTGMSHQPLELDYSYYYHSFIGLMLKNRKKKVYTYKCYAANVSGFRSHQLYMGGFLPTILINYNIYHSNGKTSAFAGALALRQLQQKGRFNSVHLP